MKRQPSHPQPPARAPASPAALPQLNTRTLFAGQREIVIEHDGALYRLRITQHNKLILTK